MSTGNTKEYRRQLQEILFYDISRGREIRVLQRFWTFLDQVALSIVAPKGGVIKCTSTWSEREILTRAMNKLFGTRDRVHNLLPHITIVSDVEHTRKNVE